TKQQAPDIGVAAILYRDLRMKTSLHKVAPTRQTPNTKHQTTSTRYQRGSDFTSRLKNENIAT
ncbi:hypothetical protein CWB74_09110, partial [Pseudoalteromonas piscicida]